MNPWLLSLLMPLTAAAPAAPMADPMVSVRVLAPAGVSLTVVPGGLAPSQTVAMPAVLGLRPGYRYRLLLGDISIPELRVDHATLAPSLEVCGMLHLPPPLTPEQYPVPVNFTADDLRRALTGGMVTKVIFLEDPAHAVPVATTPTNPAVLYARNDCVAFDEARRLGRPMVIVRLGERTFTPDEVAAENVPGTLLPPGGSELAPPVVPPTVPFVPVQFIDPVLGPKPCPEECLPDGGDSGALMGIGPDGKVHGLDPSDAAIEFTTPRGRRVCPSNRVCLCVPRFTVIRAESVPINAQTANGPFTAVGTKIGTVAEGRVPALPLKGVVTILGAQGRERASYMMEMTGPSAFEGTKGLKLVGRFAGSEVVGQVIETGEVTSSCHKLMLEKRVDPPTAQVGDIVTFALRYTNNGRDTITDVAVSDSLIGRLEYVPKSQRSDRPAAFTTAANEAGSATLRWELQGPIAPGDSGIIAFQARVR
jgi:uncharacterized repeat protein (TIGR01451 family)